MADDVKNAPNRVDGVLKVTGKAKYIAEWKFPKMAYGYLVHSTIAKGKIKAIDTSEAEKQSGVIKVLTHLNTPKFAKAETDRSHRPLHNADVLFSGQAIGVVVAETFESARYAASLVKVEYEKETPNTDIRGNFWIKQRSVVRVRLVEIRLRHLPIRPLKSKPNTRFRLSITMRWSFTRRWQIGIAIS